MMKTQDVSISRAVRAGALGVLLCAATLVPVGAASAADSVTDDNVAELVTSAKTAADHQALATYFDAQSAAAAAKVKMHEKMLTSPTMIGKGAVSWEMHCKSMIRLYKETQAETKGLADAQREMAAQG